MVPRMVGNSRIARLSWLGAAAWLIACGLVLAGVALDTYRGPLIGAAAAGVFGFALLVAAARTGPGSGTRHAPAWIVIATGAALTVVAWLLPWRIWHDESLVDESGSAMDPLFAVGHVLVLVAFGLLVAGVSSTAAARPRHWWLALMVGGCGLAVYWSATELFENMQTDTVAWNGPGVPTASLGFLAILAGAALPLR